MELLLQRISTGDESTLGIMFEGHYSNPDNPPVFQCFTMEDQPNEPKVPGETRIPAGRYRVLVRREGGMHSRYGVKFPWHQGMLWLQDVPDFKWVYIHPGNYDDDTEGCILPGDGAISNVPERGMVTRSVGAYERLYKKILAHFGNLDNEVWITIEDYA